MNSKKRMMFILEEDYYFITIKLLSVLVALECDKKNFEDYRKLGIIFEFVKSQENISFFEKLVSQKADSIFDNERAIKLFCDSKLNISVVKRVLFFLEKQGMVELQKSKKGGNIDVLLVVNKEIEGLIKGDILNEDIRRSLIVKKALPKIRSMKLSTLQDKIFGYNEVTKWDD
ncbi:MAG: hypothetical protein IJC76_00670 [Lachnospiraceae bacterium]|nr:hypothetical protein [Lachnospiraceae bacterium]